MNAEILLGELGVVLLPLPNGIANRLRAWAERIPEDALAPKGREDEPHVTVKYGLTTLDDAAVAAAVRDFGEITLTFGPMAVFEQPDQDVLVVTVESPQLEALRQKLETAVSWDDQFAGDYRAHATIAYVKKGTAAEWDGDRSFAGESAVVRLAEYVPKGFDEGELLVLDEGPGVTRNADGSFAQWELDITRDRSGQFAPGGGGECPETGCGQEIGHRGGHDVVAKAKAASVPTGLRIREAARRAFSGAPRTVKSVAAGPGKQLKVGALGEAVAASWLREQGVAAERLHIRGRNNFPLDLVSWSKTGPILWEAKAGPVSNAPSGQQWRVTNGAPSVAEAEWLKTASDAQKARYNAQKIAKAIARKAAAVKEAERVLGVPVQLKTIALILDPDRNLADVHVFDGVHPLIRWNSTQAKAGYRGSVAWAGKALAEPEEGEAQEDDGGALPPDVEAAMEAQLENEADAWLAGFLEWAREHGGGQVLSGWELAAEGVTRDREGRFATAASAQRLDAGRRLAIPGNMDVSPKRSGHRAVPGSLA